MRLDRRKSQLLIVDVQEKMAPPVRDADRVIHNCARLLRIARRLEVPIAFSEHYPKGLGGTIAQLAEAGAGAPRLAKVHFSAWADEGLRGHFRELRRRGRQQVIAAGIESHVCLGLTVLDLQANGFDCFVVADAVSARSDASHDLALQRMRQAGAEIIDTETVLFELLERAATPEFKELIELIK
jgi:nicotinamidase-related amidase